MLWALYLFALQVVASQAAAADCADGDCLDAAVASQSLLQKTPSRHGQACWEHCGRNAGYCSWCGGLCCKKDDPSDPPECKKATVPAALLNSHKFQLDHICIAIPHPVPDPTPPPAKTNNNNEWKPDRSDKHCRPDNGAGRQLRVRKEIFDMSAAEWTAFKDAFRTLQKTGAYDGYSVEHSLHYATPWSDLKDHGTPTFLPIHRFMIQDLETDLQHAGNDCSITFPFWNWALEAGDFFESNIWSDEYMGRNSGCVADGLPKEWKFPFNSKFEEDCVEREAVAGGYRGVPDVVALDRIIVSNNDYSSFCASLEKAHNIAHGAIGGNMANKVGMASPSDPMFFLHHAFIDRLWFKWQKLHPEQASDCTGCREDMKRWTGLLVPDDDCFLLPISSSNSEKTATCVRYLAEGSSDGEPQTPCKRLRAQIENDECSDEELESLPCVKTPRCTVDLEMEKEDNLKFTQSTDDEDDIDDNGFQGDMIIEQLEAAATCKSFVAEPTEEETQLCRGCDYVCKNERGPNTGKGGPPPPKTGKGS